MTRRRPLPPDTRPNWRDPLYMVQHGDNQIPCWYLSSQARLIMDHFDIHRRSTYRDEDWRYDPTYNLKRKRKPHA